jgi:excisionase family DNA binding protein
MKTFLSAAEVAKLLSVDRATVSRWIKKGMVKGVVRPEGSQQWRIPITTYQELRKHHENSQL